MKGRAIKRAGVGLALGLALVAVAVGAQPRGTIVVQLLALNDLHGHIEPASGANGRVGDVVAGGAEYLATHLKNDVARNPNSIIVAAGDLIGASPLMSAMFHDEPTVEALNGMHLDVASVGNHEFDHGWRELLRIQKGGCHPVDGCQDGDGFAGATFQYLSANVVRRLGSRSMPLFPATAVRTIGGVTIGFIGETLKGTAQIVAPAGIQGLTFLDEAAAANAYAARLRARGANAVVLLIHQGGGQSDDSDPNGCTGFSGGIVPIVRKLSADIDVVISGHTHRFYNCEIGGHYVTSAGSFGRLITRVNLTFDAASRAITAVAAANEIVTQDVPKDAAQSQVIAKYGALSASIANRVVGSVSGDITRTGNAAGESALGDVIADAHVTSTAPANKGGAVVAFMNSGGIRADIVASHQAGGERPGEVTYSELFEVQPFSDVLTVMTLTGRQIKRLLEQQFGGADAGPERILQVSRGFSYRYRLKAPAGQHVDARSIKINGRVIAPTSKVRVAIDNFLAEGVDGYTVFREGTGRLAGALDVDALTAYFKAQSVVAPGPQDRIVRLD
jgi:5'-nucleotidase